MSFFLDPIKLKDRKIIQRDGAEPGVGVGEAALTTVSTVGHGDTGVYFGQLGRRGVGEIRDSRVLGR